MYVERDYPEIREAVGNGLTIKPLNTMMNHSSTELFIENLRVQF
jgi:acyl-CoA dehydrogenase